MSLEHLLVLAAIAAVYSVLRWLAQRLFGSPGPSTPQLGEGYPPRQAAPRPRVAFEPVKKSELAPAPTSAREEPAKRRPRARRRRAASTVEATVPGAPPGDTLSAGDIVPRSPADLRRAMALVVVLNPPRALDPPP